MKNGVPLENLSKEYVPRFAGEEDVIMRRMELSKDKLFEKLVTTVNDQMKRYPEDDYLKDIFSSLKNKSSSSFGKKSDLVNVISLLDQYMYDLKVGTDYDDLLDLDSDDEV